MALCDLCLTVPFSDLPPPPSTFNGVSYVGGNSELCITWDPDQQEGGFPWHNGLDTLAESAKTQSCLICSIVQAGVGDWLTYYTETEKNPKPGDVSAYDEAPRDARLFITRRYNDELGFIVVSRDISSVSRSTNILASIGFFPSDAAVSKSQQCPLPTMDINSNSAECFDLAARWLGDCVDGHPECGNNPVGRLPRRLLDVGSSGNVVKLVETAHAGHVGLYAALSYCWGSDPLLNLTTTWETYEARIIGISLSEMPEMFRDVVSIVRYLQIRYLWIDSLCIIQSDPYDWAHEADWMQSIYSGAHVVIAPDHADNPTKGCFHKREPLPHVVVEIPGGTGKVRAQVLCRGDEFASNVGMFRTEPLSQRTWALQERVLSRRILHYATKQMYFECSQGLRSESGCILKGGRLCELQTLQQNNKEPDDKEDALHNWNALVTAASQRKLTRPTDKLPSMAGLASLFAPSLGSGYVAGLWGSNLVRGLEWASRPAPKLEGSGPSWSWAGHGGAALYFRSNTEPVAEIESCGLQRRNKQSPFGEVKHAWIRLTGPVVPLQLCSRQRGDGVGNGEQSGFLMPRVLSSYSDQNEIDIQLDDIEVIKTGQWRTWNMHLLGLTRMRRGATSTSGHGLALLLVCVGGEKSIHMRRVGYVFWESKLESSIVADETCYRTVTLV